MQEIMPDGELNVKVFINGVPDITLMPKEVFGAFIAALELQISDYYKTAELQKIKLNTPAVSIDEKGDL